MTLASEFGLASSYNAKAPANSLRFTARKVAQTIERTTPMRPDDAPQVVGIYSAPGKGVEGESSN